MLLGYGLILGAPLYVRIIAKHFAVSLSWRPMGSRASLNIRARSIPQAVALLAIPFATPFVEESLPLCLCTQLRFDEVVIARNSLELSVALPVDDRWQAL